MSHSHTDVVKSLLVGMASTSPTGIIVLIHRHDQSRTCSCGKILTHSSIEFFPHRYDIVMYVQSALLAQV